MLHLKRFEDITEADLLDLITDQIREGQHIDYKRDINLAPPKAKPEILRDVSSFANAAGGDMVIGMDETGGLPTKLTGLTGTDFEQLEQQILQSCRAHINSPIMGIRFRTVKLTAGGDAFLIRIPKTWNGPHMVMIDGENRCWTRDQSGKRKMDIPDLKQALALSESAAERMKRFRMERVGNVIAGETPVPLYSNQCIILHLLPLLSFTGNLQVDPATLGELELPPMGHGTGWRPTFTFEGKMTYTTRGDAPAFTYMLVFRNGIIEGVESSSLEPRHDGNLKGKKLFFSFHFGMLIDALGAGLKVYRKLGVSTPVFGTVSLTGVKDYRMHIPQEYGGGGWGLPVNRDTLFLPEFMIQDLNGDPQFILKETFDVWWQTCGYDSMPKWVEKR